MKTSTLPAIRVDPKLREAAERALRPNETLSRLMETALETYLTQREEDDEFVARGLRAARDARKHGNYSSADDVMKRLEDKLAAARKAAASGKGR